ncbi:hypothetical protein CJ209_09890 [Fusobacterium nucleatum]|jgi:hypothetical protein|uniref:Uncharacterized protein n=1 Tax=Fusobacterium nucleatum TaxID=851 RepID=A0A2N6TFT4_FUSNU|nr:hypothetical protein [Fusobacterium nucleatum]PMC68188.1 hypothetical protein CJ209_09890 [Fusobacterium nucleatum]
MEENVLVKNDEKNVLEIIQDSNEMYKFILEKIGLPAENILSPLEERKAVLRNLEYVVKKIPPLLLENSYYLSKFFVAISAGLFDAALNYLWDETIKQLKIRIVNGDIKYFYDVVIGDEKRKNFNTIEDLSKLDDYDLIKGALEIDLITEIGYKHLDYIRYMRNWASAAHPNQAELTGLNLITWLEMCIKEVISTPPSNIQIQIGQLLSNIKSELMDDEQIKAISSFFTELNLEKADALAKGFFGIYINSSTSQQTRTNINNLAPELWQVISEEIKASFGIRCATFIANGENQAQNEAKRFLEIVGGLSYLPDSVKSPKISTALENLSNAHNNFNNFYNEPPFAKQLYNIVGTHGTIPEKLNFLYVKTIVSVFLTNGNGVVRLAEPIYIELIKNFDPKQAFIALTSFSDNIIKSKLQFSLCKNKFEELLDYIQPNITSEGVISLLKEIKDNIRNLSVMTDSDKLIQKIEYFKKNLLT